MSSKILWNSWLRAYLFTAVAVYHIRWTYRKILEKSMEVKSRNEIQNYTVMLKKLPENLRCSKALRFFFESMCGPHSVYSAVSVYDCGKIIALIKSYENFVNLLKRIPWNYCERLRTIIWYKKTDIEKKLTAIEKSIRLSFSELNNKERGMRSHIGFVTFRTLKDATAMAQKNSFFQFHTSPAPIPENVYVKNAAVSLTGLSVSKAVIVTALIILMGY